MRMKYKIFWFEDDIWRMNRTETYQGIQDIIIFLESQGFECDLTIYLNTQVPDSYTRLKSLDPTILPSFESSDLSHVRFDLVDLVIVDFNMWEWQSWVDIIDFIRRDINEIYTEIFFYSANENETDLRIKADKDGLYCANWAEVFTSNKLERVIKTTIHKSQDLYNLRGLVMSETSELDDLMRTYLKNLCSSERAVLTDHNICCSRSRFKRREITFSSVVLVFLSKHWRINSIIDNARSSDLCSQINEYLSSPWYSWVYWTAFIDYKDDIIAKRNKLAHWKCDDTIPFVLKIDSLEFREADFASIRTDIKRYKNVLDWLIAEL